MNFLCPENFAADLLHGIAEADREERLTTVLKHVDDAPRRVLEEDVSTVGEQVVLGTGADGFYKALTQFTLKESDDFADPLKTEAALAKLANDGDLGDVVERVEAPVTFTRRNDDLALIPPLQLAGGYARQRYDFLRRESRLHDPTLPGSRKKNARTKTFSLENV
jgi:hypothetical protein